ncbi:MAG: Ser/Thr protein kinase, partial [Acidobacteria bacterium]|nr:Ser/Thr protein kinase [Acidobacteriota bacterium]
FTAENTEALLEIGARDYVNNPRGVDVVDDDFIVISSIYDWYAEDFGDTEESVMEHLIEYAEDDLAEFLQGFDGFIAYDYDWS